MAMGHDQESKMLTVDGHEQQLLRLNDVDQLIQVVEDFHSHLILCELAAWMVPVCSVVYRL